MNLSTNNWHISRVASVTAGFLCAVFTATTPPIQAEIDPLDAPLERVTVQDGDTLRGLASRYLRDPDLWPTVLELNNISSPKDIRPGVELYLPVRQVFAADNALKQSLIAIQDANAEGAQLFAPEQIGMAIENRNSALLSRTESEWKQVVSFSGIATDYAHEALDISVAARDVPGEALVSDVNGDVHGRTPSDQTWTERYLRDVLVEDERVRTLTDSTTQVTFRDQSRLRLNPNSNATIERMRADPLTGGEVTKVELANGDFYAVLNQLTDRAAFEIKIDGMESTTSSSDFWIKNDETGTRFVNFDESRLEIDASGGKILLGQNEGILISAKGEEALRTSVLQSPSAVAPRAGDVMYAGSAALSWDAYESASGYWVEVARDESFAQMILSEWNVADTELTVENLTPGRYHWRVAALDALSLPGEWSQSQRFTMRIDNTPPYLALMSPTPDTVIASNRVSVLGASEMGVQLRLNGEPLALAPNGSFLADIDLREGLNDVLVEAIDPAGNISTRNVSIMYRPAQSIDITLSEKMPRVNGAYATRSSELSVSAQTSAVAGSVVLIRDEAGRTALQSRVEDEGRLSFTVPVEDTARTYRIEIMSPAGEIEGSYEFAALRDRTPPEIRFDLPPPSAVGQAEMRLTGTIEDATRVEFDGREIPLDNGRFDLEVGLEPGQNSFQLVASDASGNLSVKTFDTLLDVEPPQITRVDLGRRSDANGSIELLVEARDASGLRQAAPYVILVNGSERDGFLRCDGGLGLCRASIPAEAGDLELIEVTIEDYAGNTAYN